MSNTKNQNRREFLLSSGWKGLITGLGFFGTSIAKTEPASTDPAVCPGDLSCHDCHKLGICEKDLAVETKKDIKTNYYKTKVSKGINHG